MLNKDLDWKVERKGQVSRGFDGFSPKWSTNKWSIDPKIRTRKLRLSTPTKVLTLTLILSM
jgi:hypothetical protein